MTFTTIKHFTCPILEIILRVRPLPADTVDAYFRRASHIIAAVQETRGVWSWVWASKIISWSSHVVRNTANASWPSKILHVRSSHELNSRRAWHSQRPNTRSSPGWCPTRWTDGVAKAIKHLQDARIRSERPNRRMIFDSIFKFCPKTKPFEFSAIAEQQRIQERSVTSQTQRM